jgi:hypothetical protein
VSQKTLTGLPDRIFYFHLRYKDDGKWSPVAHYKFKIDTTAPEPFTPSVNTVEDKNIITLRAKDVSSGVDHYTIQIDNTPVFTVNATDLVNDNYTLPMLAKGEHSIIVVAYDKAGNHTEAKNTFVSTFVVTPPTISVDKNEILTGDTVTVSGKTKYPNTQVTVSLESEMSGVNVYSATTDSKGEFSLTTDKIKTYGSITVSATSDISDGLKSEPSEKIKIQVTDKDTIKFAVKKDDLIRVGALLLALILLLAVGWIKYFGLKHGTRKLSGHDPVEDIYNATLLLRKEINKQIKILEKIKSDGTLGKIEQEALKEIQHKEQTILNDIQKK